MTDGRLFRFVQFEFPWDLGPVAGRYAIREQTGELPNQVLVIETMGALERRKVRQRRRTREAEPQPDAQLVPTTRATLVDTEAFEGAGDAEKWLEAGDLGGAADEAIRRLNRVLHNHRVASADPSARGVHRMQALVTRVGYGDGERVSTGRWAAARELAALDPERDAVKGSKALRPQERLAALLGGRDVVLACEDLVLRARGDFDDGRLRETALQLQAAYRAAVHELEPWRERPLLGPRLDAVVEQQDVVDRIADAALRSGLDDEQRDALAESLRRVEAALRARIAGGIDG